MGYWVKNYSKLKLISSAFVDGFVWTVDAKSVFDWDRTGTNNEIEIDLWLLKKQIISD